MTPTRRADLIRVRPLGRSCLLWAALAFGQVPAFGQATAAPAASASIRGFRTPTDTPSASAAAVERSPLLAVTQAGLRWVAVGLRGHIVYSDDAGKTWVQAKVPVEVDLVAVNFPTPTQGWAVGHRGVVLESKDGGATWSRRFADQQLNALAARYYEAQTPLPKTPAARALADATRAMKDKSTPSLLDVWFDTPTRGTIVGSFNTMFRTEDGGKTWAPWMDRTDNPDELHFYSVRGGHDGLFLAGEKGGVWRLDEAARQWVSVPTGYTGTLFGLVADGAKVLAFGMRGSVFTSDDAGQHWQAVATPRRAGLAAGVRLRNGDIVLADQTGELLRSKDTGRSFASLDGKSRVLAFSLAQGSDGQLFSAGPGGVVAVPLQ